MPQREQPLLNPQPHMQHRAPQPNRSTGIGAAPQPHTKPQFPQGQWGHSHSDPASSRGNTRPVLGD